MCNGSFFFVSCFECRRSWIFKMVIWNGFVIFCFCLAYLKCLYVWMAIMYNYGIEHEKEPKGITRTNIK